MDDLEAKHEAQRKKQKKKMTRILSTAWSMDGAQVFQEVKYERFPSSKGPLDLASMGQNLDAGVYSHGKRGWEMFSSDIGAVYNRFIVTSSGKEKSLAKRHLSELGNILSQISEHLNNVAKKSIPNDVSIPSTPSKEKSNKRKSIDTNSNTSNTANKKTTEKTAPGSKSKSTTGGKPRNKREIDNESKRLRRELDKLLKAREKSVKALDEFCNVKNDDKILDEDICKREETADKKSMTRVILEPDISSFPGIPNYCIPDAIMVWDFLCTFNRALSLEPVTLDEFAAALIYKPSVNDEDFEDTTSPPSPPLLLAEIHLALLKLLLCDKSSDEWWWSILETPETEHGENPFQSKGEADYIAPTIKVDMAALLAVEEEPIITKRWLQALEDVRARRTNSGGPIKSAVKSAISITTNNYVKNYLHKALRKWKGNAAGFTKSAVIWLIGKVREARPDLWGRKVSEEAVAEQKAKVANEAAINMQLLEDEPEIENIDDIQFEISDEEEFDSEEEEEIDENEEAFSQDRKNIVHTGITATERDESVEFSTSTVPEKPLPTLVDILLPPAKPIFGTELISPFTWPSLVAASVCRIIHYYKRRRNAVDDNLREFRGLSPLTIAERKRREKIAVSRLFTECIIVETEEGGSVLDAVDQLCNGGNYVDLSPLQKLSILRILVEASYDTNHIYQCVQDNIKSRIGAEKQLENEEKRAKKAAKEEASTMEFSARELLAQQAKDEFLTKKRRQLFRENKQTKEYSDQELRNFTDDDIINFDEDTRAEYDALPGPQQFNRNEVNTMVAKVNEETAFGTHALEVLTLEELENREANELASMEEELESYGDPEVIYQRGDRETSAKVDKLQKEIQNFKEWLLTLPQSRSQAIDALKDAIEDGTIKPLRSAIKLAKAALLMGQDEETGGLWALDLLRDASLELKVAERRKHVTEAQKELVAKRDKCFIRTEELGNDRYYTKYWQYDYDDNTRIWFESDYKLETEVDPQSSQHNDLRYPLDMAGIGALDEESDILIDKFDSKLRHFLCQEYHFQGLLPRLVKRHYGCISTDRSFRALIKNLDSRGIREGSLKDVIKSVLETSGLASHEETNKEIRNSQDVDINQVDQTLSRRNDVMKHGDEDVFSEAKRLAGEDVSRYLFHITTAIGQRCRVRLLLHSLDGETVEYIMGTIIGWSLVDAEVSTNESNIDKKPMWVISYDNGNIKDISSMELIEGLSRAQKWKLSSYRNKLGRFCGRAADAPQAACVFSLSRTVLRREQEFYNSLKNRNYDNNWGGKAGERTAWIASMRDYAYDISTVRDGLLTMENAFYELCGGVDSSSVVDDEEAKKKASEQLSDTKQRFDIELESLGGGEIKGLWNSKESRMIFRDIVSKSNTISFLALGLDLLCRNCQAYLDATRLKTTRNSVDQNNTLTSTYAGYSTVGRMTRSSYDQQQQNLTSPQTIGTRRMNAWQKLQDSSDY